MNVKVEHIIKDRHDGSQHEAHTKLYDVNLCSSEYYETEFEKKYFQNEHPDSPTKASGEYCVENKDVYLKGTMRHEKD